MGTCRLCESDSSVVSSHFCSRHSHYLAGCWAGLMHMGVTGLAAVRQAYSGELSCYLDDFLARLMCTWFLKAGYLYVRHTECKTATWIVTGLHSWALALQIKWLCSGLTGGDETTAWVAVRPSMDTHGYIYLCQLPLCA